MTHAPAGIPDERLLRGDEPAGHHLERRVPAGPQHIDGVVFLRLGDEEIEVLARPQTRMRVVRIGERCALEHDRAHRTGRQLADDRRQLGPLELLDDRVLSRARRDGAAQRRRPVVQGSAATMLPGDERHDAVPLCGIEKLLLRGRPRERPLDLVAADERGQQGIHQASWRVCARRRHGDQRQCTNEINGGVIGSEPEIRARHESGRSARGSRACPAIASAQWNGAKQRANMLATASEPARGRIAHSGP